jgi:hypothetical protein
MKTHVAAITVAVTLGIGICLASMSGCKRETAHTTKAADVAAKIDFPTEEDFEEAAEAAITPATLDSEVAKLESELPAKSTK